MDRYDTRLSRLATACKRHIAGHSSWGTGNFSLDDGTEFSLGACSVDSRFNRFGFSPRPLRFALGVAGLLIAMNSLTSAERTALVAERNFFGIHFVKRSDSGQFVDSLGSAGRSISSLPRRVRTEFENRPRRRAAVACARSRTGIRCFGD